MPDTGVDPVGHTLRDNMAVIVGDMFDDLTKVGAGLWGIADQALP